MNNDMQKMIASMIGMQWQLNTFISSTSWLDGTTKDGRDIDWVRCIFLEAAEAIESYPWKHWKSLDGKVDFENVKVEMIDIFHFLLSQSIFAEYKASLIQHGYKDSFIEDKLDERIAMRMCRGIPEYETNTLSVKEQFELLDHNMVRKLVSLGHTSSENYTNNLLKLYLEVLSAMGIEFRDVYELYIAKNTLNIFRQHNGYKEGTYKKQWATPWTSKENPVSFIEDNVVMQSIVNNFSKEGKELSYDNLYKELEVAYAKV